MPTCSYVLSSLRSMPEEEGPPDTEALLGSEAYDWGAVPNLDQFFTRIYR